jgi:hypothetical protein
MCPTVLGRIQTRVAILIGPAVLGTILSLATGKAGWIVLIGVYLVMGTALDIAFYPFIIRWQPPWLTFVLALGEFVILYVLSQVLKIGLSPIEAIVWYWVSWAIAITTKIVVLPIVSLGWIENAGEFRTTGWTIAPDHEPVPASAVASIPAHRPRLAQEFSAVHEIPAELRSVPSPSSVQAVPADVRAALQATRSR